MKDKKLVYGVGINNADYQVTRYDIVDGKSKQVWKCPIYWVWKDMLKRCYSEKYHSKHTYEGCCTVPEWHSFMTFRAWMVEQEWEGKELDKDILFPGNKVYGPDTCVFVSHAVNSFVTDRVLGRGQYPVGVSFYKEAKKLGACCQNVKTGKREWLGLFDNPEEAHQAWLAFKLQQAKILASEQSDPRVAAALIDRYENYAKYFHKPT